jgi:hypothetical protein
LKKKSPHKIEKKNPAILIIPVVVFTPNHHFNCFLKYWKEIKEFLLM